MESKALIRVRRTPPQGLGPLLQGARERADLSQSETGRRAGVPQSYVWKLEAGLRCPSMLVAERLADVLQLTLPECQTLFGCAVSDAGRSHPARART
ncbi:helix-turn-helix domain-containing protein [Streptomyces olivaceus]|uniref:helix-turn-helix domain-containing protein n=1 Tax=Streptomyces olivaceus TaxID=47716 RepID=UPI00380434B8